MARLPLTLGNYAAVGEAKMAVVPSERDAKGVDHGSAVHAEVRVSKRKQI